MVQLSSNCLDPEDSGEKHTEVCGQESLSLALPAALPLYQWKLTCQVNQENYLCMTINGNPNVLVICLPSLLFKFLYNLLLQEALNIFGIQLQLKLLQISLDANLCCIIFSTCFFIYFTYVYMLCCSTYLALVHILLILTFNNCLVLLVLSLNNELEIM